MREVGGGIVGYDVDAGARKASFALAGRLFLADLVYGGARELSTGGPVIDPRVDPTGSRVAYVTGGALHVVETDGTDGRLLIGEDTDDVTWGVAEFVAAEEMDRARGYWWAPGGRRLLVARVDESPVQRWHIADPAHPEQPAMARATRRRARRTPSSPGDRRTRRLAARRRVGHRRPALSRRRRVARRARAVRRGPEPRPARLQVLQVDPRPGRRRSCARTTDPHWVDISAGVPAWLADGRLVWLADLDDTRRLWVGDEVVTPEGLQVSAVAGVGDDWVLLEAGRRVDGAASLPLVGVGRTPAPDHRARPVPRARRRRPPRVESATLERPAPHGRSVGADAELTRLDSYADVPALHPVPLLLRTGRREIRTAVVLPRDEVRPPGPLPVLMSPYGGPQGRMVVAARNAYLEHQWFADQGFAVVVADGRGTPGRGPAWDRTVAHDLPDRCSRTRSTPSGVADRLPGELDLGRVAIHGWSFGGYLAALAVLRRPDVFHAAVAGAPVTDWALYDTHYTERFLGTPDDQPEVYRTCSLLEDAARLERPLMIVHGLADDNVVFAHTLRLSSALLAAGRPHTVLPLSGVTHLASQEAVAENLLLLQVEFLGPPLTRPPT